MLKIGLNIISLLLVIIVGKDIMMRVLAEPQFQISNVLMAVQISYYYKFIFNQAFMSQKVCS